MKFSEEIWLKTSPIYKSILELPFNQELANGTLSKSLFCYYIEQDSYYLLHFAKALALIAGRAQDSKVMSDFLGFANFALIAEQETIHSHYLNLFMYEKSNELTPACFAYTNFLIAHTATSPIEIAIAAVLPCFWIYREVGMHISHNLSKENNPYLKWIETYASSEFDEKVTKAITIMDEFAANSSPSIRYEMEKAFLHSSLMEWHFWNDAYIMKTISLKS